MKNLCIVLAVVLLTAVMLTDAQGFPGRRVVGRQCGRQRCRLGQRCVEVPVRCFRAPCPRLFRCV